MHFIFSQPISVDVLLLMIRFQSFRIHSRVSWTHIRKWIYHSPWTVIFHGVYISSMNVVVHSYSHIFLFLYKETITINKIISNIRIYFKILIFKRVYCFLHGIFFNTIHFSPTTLSSGTGNTTNTPACFCKRTPNLWFLYLKRKIYPNEPRIEDPTVFWKRRTPSVLCLVWDDLLYFDFIFLKEKLQKNLVLEAPMPSSEYTLELVWFKKFKLKSIPINIELWSALTSAT